MKVHTLETAPQQSKKLLEQANENLGFIPNLMGVMAQAPANLKAYQTLMGIFDETSFNATERQIVLMTASFVNGCDYCMAAHSTVSKMQNLPDDVVRALRENKPIKDKKLEALRQLTHSMVSNKGHPSHEATKAFKEAGYGDQQMLEVILGVAMKTLSNYTNHVAETPLDDQFKDMAWDGKKVANI